MGIACNDPLPTCHECGGDALRHYGNCSRAKPAEPSPEVAPMQREICNEPHTEGSKYAANKHCVHGRLLTDDCTDCHVPAVAPRETQQPLEELAKQEMSPFERDYFSAPDAPATQHRVIPVEWHRVAVEPGDACDCEDHPCPHANEQLRRLANTDDRTADTIPDDEDRRQFLATLKDASPAVLKAVAVFHRKRYMRAETRIEVLEAALRLSRHALLSGEQMDGLGERYALDGALVIEACTAIRAALAAPSGEKEKV